MVTVLDNTMGGMLTLGMQRILGTLIGGGLSIIVMTIVRAIFQPYWDARAVVVLNILMFIQVFIIAKIKLIPNYAFAGGIVKFINNSFIFLVSQISFYHTK